MMSDSLARREILDLLARGKINIDEAVGLLSQSSETVLLAENDETIYKAEMIGDQDVAKAIKVDETEKTANVIADEMVLKGIEKKPPFVNGSGRKPRWLRIRVANLDSGENRVSVNVPFAMVKFGLGIARVFSPEIEGANFDEISDMFLSAEQGLLVDVEDSESNEHVRVYLD